MSHVSYKVKLYSGDGQTFIKNLIINIPIATADGSSNITTETIINETGGNAFPIGFTTLRNKSFCKVLIDPECTMIGTGEGATYAGLGGASNVINLWQEIAGNTVPTVGMKGRLVFNNGSYILLEITQYATSGATRQRQMSFTYVVGNNVLGTVTLQANHAFFSTEYVESYIDFFPFALPDSNTTYSDTYLRYTFGSYDNIQNFRSIFRVTQGIQNIQLVMSATTSLYLPYKTNINLAQFIEGLKPYDSNEPYPEIEPSTPSGPAEATGIPENDPVDFPDVPTVSVSDTGFITLFNPSLPQVKALADYMWTGLFDLATYKKIFADPMDCLLGFNMLPVAIPHGTAVAVRVGNISTGIQMNPATSQWVEVDCGSIDVGNAFGNYLSYAPYTKFSMYLPYIGIVELSTDDVMGKTVSLKYHVDVLSCSCVAYLKCGASVLYQFTGSCGYSIPVSSNDFRATIANIVSITATVAGAIVSGGAAAGVTAGTTAKAAAKAARKRAQQKAARTASAIGDAASIGKNVMGSKPEIHRSGAIGGSAGILGMQKPYLIVEYPNPCKPEKQYHYTGYPSFVTVKLQDITGYAEFEEILVEGVPCTEAEQTMIKELCEGGIFL